MKMTTQRDISNLVDAINRYSATRFFWNHDGDYFFLLTRKKDAESENALLVREKTPGQFRKALERISAVLKLEGRSNIACPGFMERLGRAWPYGEVKLEGDALQVFHMDAFQDGNTWHQDVRYGFVTKMLVIRAEYNDRIRTRCYALSPEEFLRLVAVRSSLDRWTGEVDELLSQAKETWEEFNHGK